MKNRRFWIIAIAASVALTVLPAQAVVTKTLVTGNSNCASIGSDGIQVSVFDPAVSTTPFEVPGVVGGKIFMDDVTRRIFDFSAEGVVLIDVVVKGSGSNWYHYDPAVASDNNLEIPNGNKLNVVHFCYTAAPNNSPVAVDDAYGTAEGTQLVVAAASGVLTNDTDIEGNALTVTASDTASTGGGTVAVAADGSFTYTPATNLNGSDTFNYTVSDGTLTDVGTVTITVSAVNDAPVAVDDAYGTAEGTQLVVAAVSGVLTNDTDIEGNALTVTASDTASTGGGTVAVAADGSFTYTPATNLNGSDTFNYTVSDGTLTDVGTVTITVSAVNDAPVAVDEAYETTEDTQLVVAAVSGVLTNDTDIEGNALTVTASDTASTGGGTVAVAADGSFTYTPATNFNGSDTFNYTVSDGTLTDVGTVTITVFAGQIDCGQSTDSLGGDTVPLFKAERGNDVEGGCNKGPADGLLFTFDAGLLEDGSQFIDFVADDLDQGGGTAQFLETIVWDLETPGPGDPQFAPLRYDDHVDAAGLRLMPWCNEDPRVDGVFNGVSDTSTILPGTHTSCLVSSSTATNDTGTGLTSTDIVYTVVDGTRAK